MRSVGQANLLIEQLQQEQLLSVTYVAFRWSHPSRVVQQSAAVDNQAHILRSLEGGRTPPRVGAALDDLKKLTSLRSQILQRSIGPDAVNTSFQTFIRSLIGSLGLYDPGQIQDATAGRRAALEALLLSNLASSSKGAHLLVAAAEPSSRADSLARAEARAETGRSDASRFLLLGAPEDVDLFKLATGGPTAQRVDALAAVISAASEGGHPPRSQPAELVSELFDMVSAQARLRLMIEDKIVRDVVRDAEREASSALTVALIVATVVSLLAGSVFLLAVSMGRSIAFPLQRLTEAAREVAEVAQAELARVADDEQQDGAPAQLAAVGISSADEIGELARALDEVQVTAARLLERQVQSRRNVASMFRSIGRRAQNLTGRQIALIDALEKDATDPDLLERLYRLDHLSSRLRRNAGSLVVLSGSAEPVVASEPLEVVDVIRSALAEIEEYTRVTLAGPPAALLRPDIGPTLVLLLAELLENGVSYSPPTTQVEVYGQVTQDGLRLALVDHGVGMSPEQLAQENARLVRRERLDLAPTDVLGLFVVGRLSRRTGIEIRLGNTPNGGVTAHVKIPGRYLLDQVPAAPLPRTDLRPRSQATRVHLPERPPPLQASTSPPATAEPPQLPHLGAPPSTQYPHDSVGPGNLRRRQRGARLGTWAGQGNTSCAVPDRPQPVSFDADAVREAIEQFEAGELQARSDPVPGELTLAPGQESPLLEARQAVRATFPDAAAPGTLPVAAGGQLSQSVRLRVLRSAAAAVLRPESLALVRPRERRPGPMASTHGANERQSAPPSEDRGQHRTPAASEQQSQGLVRRVRGANLPPGLTLARGLNSPTAQADPEVARTEIEEFEAGVARALTSPTEKTGPEDGRWN
ncbi:nitrate- and nitrite sensing domain-containing protein [Streptomyces sp. NPDC054841]